MSAWDEFESALARVFRDITDRVFVIIAAEADPTRYVQFAGQPSRLDAEAPGADVVSDADESVLRASGWMAPTTEQPNWTAALALPALHGEYADLASRCVAALRDAFGIGAPEELAYRAWREAEQMPRGVTWSKERIAELDPGADFVVLSSLGISAD
ncbi:TY-Chap domain-containing protein [Microbacterium sp. GCS4]|uniref:TY-Chap domain-containing protein n=1 Tax=Microbacterium sp. GCS4 TaxID=1692239 RepID=UPI00067FE4B2|nr:hypothetical protein [Microbacterium sp. GCS4]KNY05430.1 hypothetical protein AKH00_13910 [Microbacterium sp. GCS4]